MRPKKLVDDGDECLRWRVYKFVDEIKRKSLTIVKNKKGAKSVR